MLNSSYIGYDAWSRAHYGCWPDKLYTKLRENTKLNYQLQCSPLYFTQFVEISMRWAAILRSPTHAPVRQDIQVTPCKGIKTVLDSRFHAVDSGFQALDSSLRQWNLDSRFRSLMGFRNPWAVFWVLKTRILGLQKQHFPGFRNQNSMTWGDTGEGRTLASDFCLDCEQSLCKNWTAFKRKGGGLQAV